MGLILDSSVLIKAEREGQNARQMLTAISRTAGNTDIAISVITLIRVIELGHGAARADTAGPVHPGTAHGPAHSSGHWHHGGLRCMLTWRDCLCVNVQSRPQSGMPQQLLHHLEFGPDASQWSRVRLPEGKPVATNSLVRLPIRSAGRISHEVCGKPTFLISSWNRGSERRASSSGSTSR